MDTHFCFECARNVEVKHFKALGKNATCNHCVERIKARVEDIEAEKLRKANAGAVEDEKPSVNVSEYYRAKKTIRDRIDEIKDSFVEDDW